MSWDSSSQIKWMLLPHRGGGGEVGWLRGGIVLLVGKEEASKFPFQDTQLHWSAVSILCQCACRLFNFIWTKLSLNTLLLNMTQNLQISYQPLWWTLSRDRSVTKNSVSYACRARVLETSTATGSELFSLFTWPHTTTFTLLSIFSPLEMSSIKIWKTIRS